MAVRRVARLGNPVLRLVSQPVSKSMLSSTGFRTLVDDLIDTMRDYGGVGIAGPQISEPLRVFAIEVRDQERYPDVDLFPLMVMINPTFAAVSEDRQIGSEGCLSIDGLRGKVSRRSELRADGLDFEGSPFSIQLSGFPAVIAQHEMDHLNGLVFLDRMENLQSLGFERERLKHDHK